MGTQTRCPVTAAGLAEAGVLDDARWVVYWRLTGLIREANLDDGERMLEDVAELLRFGREFLSLGDIGAPPLDRSPLSDDEIEELLGAAREVIAMFDPGADDGSQGPWDDYRRTAADRARRVIDHLSA